MGGARFKGAGAGHSAPDLVVFVLAVQLKQFLMLLKVCQLLFHVDGSRLLVDVERQFNVLGLELLHLVLPLAHFYLRLVQSDSLGVLKLGVDTPCTL